MVALVLAGAYTNHPNGKGHLTCIQLLCMGNQLSNGSYTENFVYRYSAYYFKAGVKASL